MIGLFVFAIKRVHPMLLNPARGMRTQGRRQSGEQKLLCAADTIALLRLWAKNKSFLKEFLDQIAGSALGTPTPMSQWSESRHEKSMAVGTSERAPASCDPSVCRTFSPSKT
jgi:hypothetical protein